MSRVERKWRRIHSSVWKTVFNLQYKKYRSAIANAKQQYYSSAVSNSVNSKNLWKTVNGLLHRSPSPSLPSLPVESLPQQFACYFTDKISNLRSSITKFLIQLLTFRNRLILAMSFLAPLQLLLMRLLK